MCSVSRLSVPIVVDGQQRPQRTESRTTYWCERLRLHLHYRHVEHRLSDVPSMYEAMKVELIRFDLRGRRLGAEDRARLRDLFSRFMWVERTEISCFYGSISLSIRAMPKAEWVGYFERDADGEELPRAGYYTVALSRKGELEIRGPGFD